MHGHHLRIHTDPIFAVGVETVGDLNQGQWGRGLRVEVIPDGVWTPVDVERVRHDGSGRAGVGEGGRQGG